MGKFSPGVDHVRGYNPISAMSISNNNSLISHNTSISIHRKIYHGTVFHLDFQNFYSKYYHINTFSLFATPSNNPQTQPPAFQAPLSKTLTPPSPLTKYKTSLSSILSSSSPCCSSAPSLPTLNIPLTSLAAPVSRPLKLMTRRA